MLRQRFASVFPQSSVTEVLGYLRARVPILEELTTLQLREAMLDCTLRHFGAGEIVFRRGEYTNSLWNITEGAATVADDDTRDGTGIRIGAGEFFGELGLLSGRRRTSTVVAAANSVMLEIPLRAMRKLQTTVAGVQRELDRVAIRRLVHNTLGRDHAIAELEDIISASSLRAYKAGASIISEGEPIDALYILRSGSATVAQQDGGRPHILSFISAGGLFGERGFLDAGATRSATVRATVASEAVRIETDTIRNGLLHMPTLRQTFARAVQQQMAQTLRTTLAHNRPSNPARDATAVADFLVSRGVGEATNVFIIDEAICTRCGNCEAACAATHGGISRVSRDLGASAHAILVPLACRHCETPHCMENCPVDAISRAPTGEVIIDQATCIGCEKCAEDCPYDVISMVDIGARHQVGWLSRMLEGAGLARQTTATGLHDKKAVKCDLCSGTGGIPACVTACPTGAAIRTDPETYLTWLREGDEGSKGVIS
jgi:CRP-like cAMP-binding protein/Fe-S-cluster-containing hydrogenase component 2